MITAFTWAIRYQTVLHLGHQAMNIIELTDSLLVYRLTEGCTYRHTHTSVPSMRMMPLERSATRVRNRSNSCRVSLLAWGRRRQRYLRASRRSAGVANSGKGGGEVQQLVKWSNTIILYCKYYSGVLHVYTCAYMHVRTCTYSCHGDRETCYGWLQWSGCGEVILSHEANHMSSLGEQRSRKECRDRWRGLGKVIS